MGETRLRVAIENRVDMKTNDWIPLLDYALKNDVSLSTLRRYIKANKVQYKIEKGRYLLLDQAAFGYSNFDESAMTSRASTGSNLKDDPEFLRIELQRAHEEIAELKTLIALYEEKIAPSNLPSHPTLNSTSKRIDV
jgi:hypothetical protein